MKPDRWQHIDELFHAVAERAPHEREAFLDEACAGNDSLRREVESLLAADSAAEEMATAKLPAKVAAEMLDKPSARVAAGQLLNQYRILSALGAGGMGEVFLAEDSRLKRKVALKLLPAHFASDPDRVRRFEQEAQAVSALNHPNILTIYEVGESERHHFLVTEFIEGQTLRQQLNDGRLPVRAVLNVATQVVSALAAAHAAGIIHRDIKPENIMVRPDGVTKVLDFGLAKLTESGITTSEPAEKKASTESGVVMGTIGYMSPEQVRGQKVDHRSDIFAVGVILYEMLSGQRAFTGDSAVEVMNAILKEEPPELAETNAKISPALDRIVRRCLEKKPEHRFQSASDLGFALSTLTTPSGARLETNEVLPSVTGNLPATGKARLFGDVRLAWFAAVLLLLAMFGLLWGDFTRQPVASAVAGRFTIAAPEQVHELDAMALSPDGRTLAFKAWSAGKNQLWIRPLDSFTARALPGTVGSSGSPFWSPDSHWIAFRDVNKLKKIDLTDGTQQTICDVSSTTEGFGGTWNRAGDILIYYSSIIYRVPATGGTPVPVPGFEQVRQGITRRAVRFLPDGQHFLYLATAPQQESPEIYLGSLDGKVNKPLLKTNSCAIYTTTAEGEGRLLFVRNGTLMAQSFDAKRLTLTGEPFRVAESVRVAVGFRGDFSASDNGTLIYVPRGVSESTQLTWIDRTGKPLESVNAVGTDESLKLSDDEFPKLSADGRRVAIELADPNGNGDAYVLDLARGAKTRVTFDPGNDRYPIWSPDGNHIVWLSTRGGERAFYRKLASGGGQEELLLKSDVNFMPYDWSADGRFILYMRYPPQTRGDIWVLPLRGDRQPIPFLQTPFHETRARFSPDGRWIAYMSNETGAYEIYVQPFPATGAKWQVSTKSGSNPQWRGDGKELYYHADDGKQIAVEVRSGKTFEPGVPQVLFDLREARLVSNTNYAVAKDGQRFLFVTRPQLASADLHFVVVTNWAATEAKK
jgi:eukaryotic-like serine/threonine-protein kinase